MKLEGKKAIVTGAAKGMGAAITTTLAREGADLLLTARDSLETPCSRLLRASSSKVSNLATASPRSTRVRQRCWLQVGLHWSAGRRTMSVRCLLTNCPTACKRRAKQRA